MKGSLRNFSMNEYLVRRYHRTQPRFGFTAQTAKEFQTWQREFREILMQRLGPWPARCDLNAQEEEPIDAGDHWRQRVVFDAEQDMSVPAWLLRPKNRPLDQRGPAILALHGHGNGKDDVVGLNYGEPSRTRLITSHNHDYARQLVQRGYVVLAPDWRGWGERGLGFEISGAEGCDFVFMKAILFGIQLLTLNIWDAQRCLDYLCTRPDVDPQRLGCVGLSFGGNLTLWLSALDERIKVAVVCCFLSTYLAHGIQDWTCGNEVVSGLLLEGEMADVAGLIAPRAALFQNGEFDSSNFPIAAARAAFENVKHIYSVAGVTDRAAFYAGPGGHQFYSDSAFEWFEKWL